MHSVYFPREGVTKGALETLCSLFFLGTGVEREKKQENETAKFH